MKVTRIAPKYEGKKLRVAAYCRVSTDKSSQEESLETQQKTYEAMIRCNPKWEYAGIYVDEGRTGVTDKREGFQQMIADARRNAHFLAGKLYCAQCGGVFIRKTYKDRKGNLSRAWKCKGRAEGLCTAPIWKEDDLVDRIGDALSINCNAAGMAEVGSLLIGDRIEQTA